MDDSLRNEINREEKVDENIQDDLTKRNPPTEDKSKNYLIVHLVTAKTKQKKKKKIWARARDRTGDLAQSMLG